MTGAGNSTLLFKASRRLLPSTVLFQKAKPGVTVMRVIGYARVSTADQDTRLQLDALTRAGIDRLHSESCSGVGARPVLRRLLQDMQPGDTLCVWKIDRIARSLPDLLRVLDRLEEVGASFRSLTEPIETGTPLGNFCLQMLGAVAQLERSMIRERVLAGQVAALLRGGRVGRPPALDQAQSALVVAMYDAGEKKARIARALGVQRHVVYRIIGVHENPLHPKYGPRRPVLGPLLAASS